MIPTSDLKIKAIRTPVYQGGSLADFIFDCVPQTLVHEEMILAVTSKIVSLCEGAVVPRDSISKFDLVKNESDVFLGEIGYGTYLTIKEGLLIPSAGIDESNSANGDYILYPKNPFLSAQILWTELKQKWKLEKLGVVLTDSHTTPLRRGVTGIALSFWGFAPLRDLVGFKDLFGRELKMTTMNLADGIAGAAVMMMGEGSESTPLAVVSGVELEFCSENRRSDLLMPLENDLYAPILIPFLEKK